MDGIARNLKLLGLGLGLAASLSACSSLKSALGIEKKPPDEFAVVTKAPLVIPPDFALHPPRPGAQDSQALTPSQAAEQTVFGKVETPQAVSSDQSQGELALLEAAGAERADGSVRTAMAADEKAARSDRSLTDRLMFWKGDGSDEPAMDGAAERERIKENEAAGKSPAQEPEKTAASSASEKGGFWSSLWPF